VNINFTQKELEVLDELSARSELSPEQVLRQALRVYQAISLGVLEVKERNPMPKLNPDLMV
jgi:hypothetical protein